MVRMRIMTVQKTIEVAKLHPERDKHIDRPLLRLREGACRLPDARGIPRCSPQSCAMAILTSCLVLIHYIVLGGRLIRRDVTSLSPDTDTSVCLLYIYWLRPGRTDTSNRTDAGSSIGAGSGGNALGDSLTKLLEMKPLATFTIAS